MDSSTSESRMYTAGKDMVDKKPSVEASVVPAGEKGGSHKGIALQGDDFEVFKARIGGNETNYRSVGWVKAAFLMLKVIFSIGILSLPSLFQLVGAVPGCILVVAWTLVNTYCAFVQGAFRNKHPNIHTVADMGYTMWGPIGREIVGILYILAYVMVAGNSILACSISLNALSDHATCTVVWSAITLVFCVAVACMPKFSQIGLLTWIGCVLIITSVFILTVAVGVRDRPAAAPQTGPFDLGFKAFNNPGFILGMTASDVFFVSSAGTSSFLPVMAEMRNPLDYKKSVALGMLFTTCSYLAFSLVIYRYTGNYIASPALGSAGTVIKKITYGLALPSLLITTILVLHISSKYAFVRILRNTRHLQEKTVIHWAVWIGSTIVLGVIAFIIAEGIPFFNQLLGLIGAICFGPIALMLPACIWLFDYGHYRKEGLLKKTYFGLNCFLFVLGLFVSSVGTYAAVVSIRDAYNTGAVGSAFSCANDA